MEKPLRGAADSSLLPAGAGLGTASIDPIAARWDQQQGGSGGEGQTLPQRGFLSLWLSGIPLGDRLPGSPQCPRQLPRSSLCRGGGDAVQPVLPRDLSVPSLPQKHHLLSPLKCPWRPQPQIPATASPATSPLCNSYGAAIAARGRGVDKSMAIKIPRCNHN